MNNQEKTKLLELLSALILKSVPKADTVSKYGGTLYTLKSDAKEGQFCGLFSHDNHVQLVLSQGALLTDHKDMLEGKGKLRRHINFTSADDIDKKVLTSILKDAAKIST